MIGTRSWRTDVAIVSGPAARKPEMGAVLVTGSLHGRRSAIAAAEPEDAHLTGMTRSLDRRLLALNLKPAGSVAGIWPALKVA